MKAHKSINLFFFFALALFVCSCSSSLEGVTNSNDYNIYLQPGDDQEQTSIEANIEFWSDKLEGKPIQYPYLSKLATAYTQLFDKTGNIEYLISSEELLIQANEKTNFNNAGLLRSLAHNHISQHKFKEALALLKKAETNGEKLKATQKMLFDVYLELGNSIAAEDYLNKIKNRNDFDFLIRQSKWSDHEGDLDRAIYFMEQAVAKAELKNDQALMQWSYTNLADFYGHKGRIKDSYSHYLKALEIDPHDSYSKKGIAWIAYAHDDQPQEALRIIQAIEQHDSSPDLYLLKAEIAEYTDDLDAKRNHLDAYFSSVDNHLYGDMYNVYTALLYVDETKAVDKALQIAQREVDNRPTTKSYDLLAWAYFNSGNVEKATEIMEGHVANKTSEPDVLFHMANIYKSLGKDELKDELKKELMESTFELGPIVAEQVRLL